LKSIAETSVWSSWSLDRKTAIELAAHLRHTQPANILECGSGYSTVVLAEYARDTGARVTTLEHDPLWMSQTRGILIAQGLAEYVDLRVAPLHRVELPDQTLGYWYNTELPDGIDFALIDGPPGKYGRHAAMHAIKPKLATTWEAWLDDANRPGEIEALGNWLTSYGISHQLIDLPHGLAVMGVENKPVDASDLTITILTGHRVGKLVNLLTSVLFGAPGLLETARVIVCHNGRVTDDVLDRSPFIDQVIRCAGDGAVNPGQDPRAAYLGMAPLGIAMGLLTSHLKEGGLWLHLEDDWCYATTQLAGILLRNARTIMEDPLIGQLRLRHLGETTRSMEQISWEEPIPFGHRVAKANYTRSPSLMRTSDARAIWQLEVTERTERVAMENFLASGLLTAQLIPGAFHHQSTTEKREQPIRYRRGMRVSR
jgi:hypothetical protein